MNSIVYVTWSIFGMIFIILLPRVTEERYSDFFIINLPSPAPKIKFIVWETCVELASNSLKVQDWRILKRLDPSFHIVLGQK